MWKIGMPLMLAMLGMVMCPEPERVLMIGLGGGAFTSLLRRQFPSLWIDAVEIDPVVVEARSKKNGVLAANLWKLGNREETIASAFRSVFAQTACIRSTDGLNLLLFGKAGGMPSLEELVRAAQRFTAASGLSFDLGEIAARAVVSSEDGSSFCRK